MKGVFTEPAVEQNTQEKQDLKCSNHNNYSTNLP